MRHLIVAIALVTLACAHPPAAPPRRPVIQLAVLLDTSNSMDGLIDQARTQLWRVVNEFGAARKHGIVPELRVALYEYGNDSLPESGGYIRQVLPFTSDLDRVSEELFALKTNGGSEYCGQVIGEAVQRLQWSTHADDLKVIFIAGNEPFTRGTIDYRNSCARALERGIIVNTIFCGDQLEGLQTKWGVGATMADGRYVAIDQNAQVAEIETPYDAEIAALGVRMNDTYIAYGSEGAKGRSRQSAQDQNLVSKKAANVQRQIAKTSANYTNVAWDLIDAKKAGRNVEVSELPPALQRMSATERKAFIEKTEKERDTIKQRIAALDAQRKKYIAAKKKGIPPAQNTLDAAIVGAVRDAGKKRGFTFSSAP